MKSKDKIISEMIEIIFKIESKCLNAQDRTLTLQMMAHLAKNGEKDSEMFKSYERSLEPRKRTDLGDEASMCVNIASKIRKCKDFKPYVVTYDNEIEKESLRVLKRIQEIRENFNRGSHEKNKT